MSTATADLPIVRQARAQDGSQNVRLPMRAFAAAPIVVVAFLASACSDTAAPMTTTGPTTVSVRSADFSASTGAVFSQQMGKTACPAFPPFVIPVDLIVRVNGGFNVFLINVNMQFVDSTGIVMPQMTLPAPQLTAQFGTALVQARSSRTFPFTIPVGCGSQQKGTLTIQARTRDEQGREDSGQVSLKVD